MKYCSHCGAEIPNEEAEICLHCGCRIEGVKRKKTTDGNVLGTIAKIFLILTIVSYAFVGVFGLLICGIVGISGGEGTTEALAAVAIVFAFLIIPLAWCIPMTVSVWRKLNNKQPVGTALKICVLLFVNVVSGILLLCMDDN